MFFFSNSVLFIACGYKTPYISMVQDHVNNHGPFHDNRCPRCPERFISRKDLLEHQTRNNHHGFRCGICEKAFDVGFNLATYYFPKKYMKDHN